MLLKDRLGKELLFFDGAMGTLLQERGLSAGELPEIWNITKPDEIYNIHKSYLDHGCDIIKTNTFGANRLKLEETGHTVDEVISKAVNIARKAVSDSGKTAYAALDISSTGKLLAPFGDLGFEQAYDIFSEMVICGQKAGADAILIETMSDLYEVKAAMLAAKEHSKLPVIVTFSFDEQGKLLTGGDIPSAVCLAESLGADALGFNCGLGPKQVKKLLPLLTEYCSIPIVINPNAGLPVSINGKTVFNVEPEEFSEDMLDLVKGGVHVVGGCCGTTPKHIEATVKKCHGIKPSLPVGKNLTMVCSYAKSVVFGKKTIVVGERLNPTGKPRMKQALSENDMDYIYREGLAQVENGTDILDVNVGLPGIDEPAVLFRAITGLQSITDIPLQIDTSDTNAMERALRIYNGKPLLNSVNGKPESMHSVFPLVKKYGATVVALTLDENGIPDTSAGRIAIAEKIIKTAAEYGISKNDIIIDALAMTISTGQDNAKIALETVDYVRNILSVHTILGVSNISFGLPERENINSAFFTLAMGRGLSSAIINPLNPAIMNACFAYGALSGTDEGCTDYIDKYAGQPAAPVKHESVKSDLSDSVIKGLKEQAAICAKELLRETPLVEIIDGKLVPALDEVGRGFAENRIFLPQLLMSAEAAKAAFEEIKLYMLAQGVQQEKKGKIILATVKGDIHDIGKNIVKALLENYNFEIIDLGRDVPPETVVQTALDEDIKLVGLSALMTTTVTNMEITIKMLREKAPQCKIMVGGAVLTQEYTDKIGADFYSKDAMGSVSYANEVFA